MTGWRHALPGLCRGVVQAHMLGADPGGMAVLGAIEPELRRHVAAGEFHVEGWAAGSLPRGERRLLTPEAVSSWGAGTALWLGARMDFPRTREVLSLCREHGVRTIFVFDHWKNYTASFLDDETGDVATPDHVLVPDQLARDSLRAAWRAVPALDAALERVSLTVFGHPGIEAAVARVREQAALAPVEYAGAALLVLDPFPPGADYGYDVPSVIAFLAQWLPRHRPGVRVLVKPHPRQSPPLGEEAFAAWTAQGIDFEVVGGPLDPLMAQAAEVWGMTSVALLIALALDKPIVSFQPGRNAAGERESNLHLERHVVL